MHATLSVKLRTGLALLAAAATLGACNVVSLTAEASDTWTRHYSLSQGGAVEIRNTNGKTEVLAGDGDAVDVTATKTVRAMTDETAKDALKNVQISETVSPDRISLDSTQHDNLDINFNLSKRVDYVVHVPRWANVELRATNGELRIRDLAGSLRASTTNGVIDGEALGGKTTASATNGRVTLDFAQVGNGDIECETTNGAIHMTLPPSAKATLTASVTNGGISTNGLDLSVSEKSRRRLQGTLNGGGTAVRLSTTNGAIAVSGR
jgi:hypothetical protein